MENMKWIPCDERLPEESGYYLTTTDNGNVVVLSYSTKHSVWNAFDDLEDTKFSIPVLAWLPLPPRYKEV